MPGEDSQRGKSTSGRWARVAVCGGLALALTAVVAVHPVAAPAASAAEMHVADSWSEALLTTGMSLNSMFNDEKELLGGGGIGLALTLAGPILSSIFGAPEGPSIQDVLDKLDGIEDDLAKMQTQLATIDDQILDNEAATKVGDCDIETTAMQGYRTTVYEINEDYAEWIDALARVRTSDDLNDVKVAQNAFISKALGGDTEVFTTPLANAVDNIHHALTGTGGVITTCGQAALQKWRNATAAGTAPGAVGADASGAWVDDRGYYADVTQAVQFWQTIESHAVFLLQQAVYLKLGSSWPTTAPALTDKNAQRICTLAKTALPNEHELCTTLMSYGGTTAHNYLLDEWKAAGVPLTDDQVMLSLGTSVTGLKASNGDEIPSTAWLRNPATSGIAWATTPQPWTVDQTAATVGAMTWTPATGAQWEGLDRGYRASHPSVSPAVKPPRKDTKNGMYADSKVQPYAPLDILPTMQKVSGADGLGAFTTDGVSHVWMPKETATPNLNPWPVDVNGWMPNTQSGLMFPPQYVYDPSEGLPYNTFLSGMQHSRPYYTGPGLGTKCMVLSPDGVLCDPAVVSSWWASRVQSDYAITDSTYFAGDYTVVGNFSVAPLSSAVTSFTASGDNTYCASGACPISFNSVSAVPGWISGFTGSPDDTASLWPAAAIPDVKTSPGCWTVWGVPTVCGAKMDDWLAANIPNPAVAAPVLATVPEIVAVPNTQRIASIEPTWASTTSPTAGALVSAPDMTWTFTAAGKSWGATSPKGRPDIAPADVITAAGWADVTSMDATATWTSWFAHAAANKTIVSSATVSLALVDGNWVVEKPSVDVVLETVQSGGATSATSTVTVTNTGNVPLSSVDVRHDAPGGSELVVSWPADERTLAPGQTATGTATIVANSSTPSTDASRADAKTATARIGTASAIASTSSTGSPTVRLASVSTGSTSPQTAAAMVPNSSAGTITVTSSARALAPSGAEVTDVETQDIVLIAGPTPTTPPTIAPTVPSPARPPAASASGSLARTGSDVPVPAAVGLILLAIGGTALAIARRRRAGATQL